MLNCPKCGSVPNVIKEEGVMNNVAICRIKQCSEPKCGHKFSSIEFPLKKEHLSFLIPILETI